MPPNVSIVILNYNGRNHLETFLPSVIDCKPEYAEIIVADNGSTDDSVLWLVENYPGITLVQWEENLGFAGGYERALEKVKSPYYFILNSDVQLTPGSIESLVQFLEDNPSVAAVQPKILSYTNPTYFEHAGASGGFLDKNCFPFCRGRIFDSVEKDERQYDEIIPIFWASGAALFIRNEDYHAAGGFDSEFFAHMEEIDLCWRLQRMGRNIEVVPDAKVYHLGGGTLAYQNPYKTYLNFRNNLYMMHKNLADSQLFTSITRRLLLDGVAAVRYLFAGDIKNVQSVFKAHMDYYKKVPYLNQKRKEFLEANQAFTKKEDLDGWMDIDILRQYFIKGNKSYSSLGK